MTGAGSRPRKPRMLHGGAFKGCRVEKLLSSRVELKGAESRGQL